MPYIRHENESNLCGYSEAELVGMSMERWGFVSSAAGAAAVQGNSGKILISGEVKVLIE